MAFALQSHHGGSTLYKKLGIKKGPARQGPFLNCACSGLFGRKTKYPNSNQANTPQDPG
ncbi:uncharacterized protein METZ01_LOCUS297649, partial [marine metagenome]